MDGSHSSNTARGTFMKIASASPYKALYYLGFVIFCSLVVTNLLIFYATKNPILANKGIGSGKELIVRRVPAKYNFTGFNNETGADKLIVPNIIHFIHFNKTELTFVDYVVLQAAMRNHGPDKFYIHTNNPKEPLTGKYWDLVRKDKQLWPRIEIQHLELPSEIFGQKLSPKWRLHHGSDIGRIRLLMKYGGIYLDNDVYVIKNLDKYRKFEFVLNLDAGKRFMGTQVLVAHKDARFLPLWLDTYREYRADKWYYNAGEKPSTEVLHKQPQLIHRVQGNFGAATGVSMKLYRDPDFKWRELDAIHLLMNHRSYLDKHYNETRTFDEDNIKTYKYPFGEMAREVLQNKNAD